jgi:uncharacterized protein (TIGR02217 family)
MSLFVEERFNTEIRYGVSGGPLWSTDIVEVQSGIESANVNWSSPLGQWQLGQDIYNKKETDYLINFFNTRMGRAVGFRFKDWSDYKVQLYPGVGTTALPPSSAARYSSSFAATTPTRASSTRRCSSQWRAP